MRKINKAGEFFLFLSDLSNQYADTAKSPIKILVSDEVVHQIESRILKLILEKILKFQNVKLISYKSLNISESVNDILFNIDK